MIRFMCDSCGKDISEKIHDSIRQFYPVDYFRQEPSEGEALEIIRERFPGARHNPEYEPNEVRVEVRLLEEFSKLMHAHAWDMSSPRIHCSNCAVNSKGEKRGKVLTIFTKVMGK